MKRLEGKNLTSFCSTPLRLGVITCSARKAEHFKQTREKEFTAKRKKSSRFPRAGGEKEQKGAENACTTNACNIEGTRQLKRIL